MNLRETMTFNDVWPDGSLPCVWETQNDFLGGQVGLRADLVPLMGRAESPFSLKGRIAFVLFVDSAKSIWTPYTLRTAEESVKRISPALDAGLAFGFRGGKLFELFAGYDFFWLNSVAKAVEQMGGTYGISGPTVTEVVFGSLFIHGLKAGVALRF